MQAQAQNRKQLEAGSMIHGDRRTDRRYPIELDLRYRLLRRKKVVETGHGKTLDMSSGGILIETERPLPPGYSVELSIAWPVLLRNIAPLQLVVSGRVVRNEANCSAIRVGQHEFRTQGIREVAKAMPAPQVAAYQGAAGVFISRKVQ